MCELVLANSLTQVMWGFHYATCFGNVVIALVEGTIIAAVFRVNVFRAIGWMIVANLASAWAARFVYGVGERPTPLVEWFFDEPLYHARAVVWICIAVGVAMTLLIEWPFCWLTLRDGARSLRRSIKALLLVHVVSITCLCGWFWPPSSNTLGREVTVVRHLELDPSAPQGWVYYVHRHRGEVHRVRLDGSRDELVMQAGVDPHRAIMWVDARPWIDEIESYVLKIVWRDDELREQTVAVLDPVTRIRPFLEEAYGEQEPGPAAASWTLAFGMAQADLRLKTDADWIVNAEHNRGLSLLTNGTEDRVEITFDTPFDTWRTHVVTALPGDLAVFDFGLQVCLLNVRTREVTLLAHGVGPVVVLDSQETLDTP